MFLQKAKRKTLVTSVCETFHTIECIPMLGNDEIVSIALNSITPTFSVVNINSFMVIIGDLQGRGIHLLLRDV